MKKFLKRNEFRSPMNRWQFSIDVGGTFTDCFAIAPDGSHHRAKVLSSSAPLSPLVAIRQILKLDETEPLPPVSVRLGTTKGTNALLTRSGARTALVTTAGFADVLKIGDQTRPHLFALDICKVAAVYAEVAEVQERVLADGSILQELNINDAERVLNRLKENSIESIAICLMHANANPIHEAILVEMARRIGFTEVSVSHHIAPVAQIVPRGNTTVADAYLNPVLHEYLERVSKALGPHSNLRILTSDGGLVKAAHFRGKDSLLSGPAGGVVGFAAAARSAGVSRAIGFDMGGTSTDVSRYSGEYERVSEIEKNGLRLFAPALAIETVAAGGGSICKFDGTKLVVGPDSAGAEPGPACYGRGGPLALTDMNLVLGRICTKHFPFSIARDSVMRKLEQVAEEICKAEVANQGKENQGKDGLDTSRMDPIAIAEGFLRVANFRMVKAIQSISIAKGVDPRDHCLVCFGGAAPQHACAIARELEIKRVLIHPDASILSAVGVAAAEVVRSRRSPLNSKAEQDTMPRVTEVLGALSAAALSDVESEGISADAIRIERSIEVRYCGHDTTIPIKIPDDSDSDDMISNFTVQESYHAAHKQLYGYDDQSRDVEIVTAEVRAFGQINKEVAAAAAVSPIKVIASETADVVVQGSRIAIPMFHRSELPPGASHQGPALIADPFTTTFVDEGWSFSVLGDRQLLLEDQEPARLTEASAQTVADPVSLEVFNQAFAAIATQMGITLKNTASSVNVKQRQDFSCAVFTPTGELVVNAPHVPVHLGAMSETVRWILNDHQNLQAGDVIVTNDPYRGGSHLPDLTVVSPVFDESERQLRFFVANRAHHAEIGGISPGSMPAFSKNLAEEGVLIRSMKVVERGESRLDVLRDLLLQAPYPSRDVETNLRDVAAQIAANKQGASQLATLIDKQGWQTVSAYMHHIQVAAERKMRSAIAKFPDGIFQFQDSMDDGWAIAVTIQIIGDAIDISFDGSAEVHPSNLNANRAIVSAAVIYVMRCMMQEDIPLNAGVMKPVTLQIPVGILSPPAEPSADLCAAMAGGNVETSQRLVDVLLAALGLAAASQGTMNNLLFGNEEFGYYETICGGAGATANTAGADAVHTHMTNTRMTDPELFEQRLPVRLHRFSIRRGSGGNGLNAGGAGVIREIEFLEPLKVSLLTQRRTTSPFGLAGGMAGSPGVNCLARRSGEVVDLGGIASIDVQPGDRLRIETPGGGGWGRRTEFIPLAVK